MRIKVIIFREKEVTIIKLGEKSQIFMTLKVVAKFVFFFLINSPV